MPVHDPRFTESHRQSMIDFAREEGVASERSEWTKAFALLGAGFLGTFLTVLLGAGPEEAAGMAFIYPVLLGAEVATGIAALYLASMIVGDLGTLPLAIARLAGIFAITDLAFFLLFGSLGCWGIVCMLALYVFLFMWLFDLETPYAIIVMFLALIAKAAAYFLVAVAAGALLG